MAYIWEMVLNFGDNESGAKTLKDDFDRKAFEVPHAGEVTIRTGTAKHDSDWETEVIPYVGNDFLNGHGGPGDDKEQEDLDAAAKVLYDRLRNVEGYRFAVTGVEVGEWRTTSEMVEEWKPRGFFRDYHTRFPTLLGGLVLHETLWESAEKPAGFEPFSKGYVWIPLASVMSWV